MSAATAPTVVRSEAELRVILAPVVNNVWPIDRLLALCAGWYRGDTTSEIGKQLGVSKSGIIGKAARLCACGALSHRPNPRAPHPDQSPEAKRKRQRDNEAHYRRRHANQEFAAERSKRQVPLALNKPLAPRPVQTAPPPAPYAPPPKYGRIADCCWPLGIPGKPDFHFCDKPTDPGRPYCHTHVGKAYTKAPVPMTAERVRA